MAAVLLVVVCSDKMVRLLDATTLQEVTRSLGDQTAFLLRAGSRLMLLDDESLRIYDAETTLSLVTMDLRTRAKVCSLSPDFTRLAYRTNNGIAVLDFGHAVATAIAQQQAGK